MRHTCRGTINLATANITVEDSCNFIISNGGAQTYHLKASSEVERQRWVTALELAKAKAVKMLEESGTASQWCRPRAKWCVNPLRVPLRGPRGLVVPLQNVTSCPLLVPSPFYLLPGHIPPGLTWLPRCPAPARGATSNLARPQAISSVMPLRPPAPPSPGDLPPRPSSPPLPAGRRLGR